MAFYGCTWLRRAELPEGLSDIGAAAFENCTVMNYVYLPKSIEYIGKNVFIGNIRLKRFTYGGTVDEWNNIISVNFSEPDAVVECTDGEFKVN